jgi:biotin operon repressor
MTKDLTYVVYGDMGSAQIDRVYSVLIDFTGTPLTLERISELTNIPASSVGSRIRDLRAGGFKIERTVAPGNRVFAYAMK